MSAGRSSLRDAVTGGAAPEFDPFTGFEVATVSTGAVAPTFRAAELGLEAPRFCQLCGRRMVVQVHPTGWTATCSRHGGLSADDLVEQR